MKARRQPIQPMQFAEFEPSPDLRAWVDCYWQFRMDAGSGPIDHPVPPDGGISLSYGCRQREMIVVGPFVAPYTPEVRPGDVYWGVRFWPGTAPAFLGVDPGELRERIRPAVECLGAEVEKLIGALRRADTPERAFMAYERWLCARLPGRQSLDPAVMKGVFRLIRSAGQERIDHIAADVALSPRQFRRRFHAAVGLSPKELARVRRFRESAKRVVRQAESRWVEVAAEHGYADQAHLAHEFQNLIGLSPTSFESRFAQIRHELVRKEND